MQLGFVIDHRRCIGCHACTVACKSENDVPVGSFRTWVKYTEIGAFPQVRRHFAVLRCNQCTAAPCVTICPVTALHKRSDGIVDLDRDVCIGCKACMQACPYDALYINDATGGAEKCHFCAHRVEQGLKPACEVVCPTEAIISGDFDDADGRVAQLKAQHPAVARRTEQGTGPNVWYLGMDDVSLHPGRAREPDTWLWSERRLPPPADAAGLARADARTVLNASHPVHWGWRVDAYLVTKGIAGGAAMLAPFAATLGLTGAAYRFLPELVALVALAVTNALLVLDLKRPLAFLRILTRPNTRSWLVRGAWVLIAFGAVVGGSLLARLAGAETAADALRWLGLPAGAAAAGYTAFLFAQCEGRDLWQNTRLLLPHLLVQAALAGAATLLLAAPTFALAWIAAIAAAAHLLCVAVERNARHPTDNARHAVALLPMIPAWPGAPIGALALSTVLMVTGALGLLWGAFAGALGPALAWACGLEPIAGVLLWERAYVRAGQLPPLS